MRVLLFTRKTLPFLLFLLTCNFLAKAQTQPNPVLIVSPHVGEVIDLEEKIRFNLFPFINNAEYQIGRFLLQPDKQIVLEIIKRNGTAEHRPFTQTEFDLTGQLIEAKAANPVPETPKPTPAAQPSQPRPAGPISNSSKSTVNSLQGRIFYVILKDGMKFFATIIEKRPNEYVFQTQHYGVITSVFSDIRYLKEVENRLRQGEFWIPTPHDSRLFFGPTGKGIPRGEGYFQTIYGYLNTVNYGVSDNFSVGTSFLLIPGLPLEYAIYSLTPKLSLPLSKHVSLAAGALYATVYGTEFGIIYGAGTIGNRHDNITAGLGYTFFDKEVGTTPVIMFGGVKRVSNRISLMTENYLVARKERQGSFESRESIGGGLYGLRFIWPRTNLDVAGFYFYETSSSNWSNNNNFFVSSYIFPAYVSFTFKFGNRRGIGKVF